MKRTRNSQPFPLGQEVEVLGRRGTVIAILTVPSCIVRFADGRRYIIRQSAMQPVERTRGTAPVPLLSGRRDIADTPLLRRSA